MNTTYTIGYDSYNLKIAVEEPNECPICKHSLKPTILHKQIIADNNKDLNVYITYLCTHCYKPFICQFTNLIKDSNASCKYHAQTLALIEPNSFQKRVFDDCISKLSSDFVNIYNQSLEAEHLKLDQIAGMGYRKALEFLIKDFIIFHER